MSFSIWILSRATYYPLLMCVLPGTAYIVFTRANAWCSTLGTLGVRKLTFVSHVLVPFYSTLHRMGTKAAACPSMRGKCEKITLERDLNEQQFTSVSHKSTCDLP